MGAHAAMKVTRPVMVMALLYFSFTDPRRSQKKIVDAIIEARVKERELYTRSNCAAFIGYIMVCEVLKREPVRHGVRVGARVHRFRACKSGRAQRSATRTGDGGDGDPTVPNLMTVTVQIVILRRVGEFSASGPLDPQLNERSPPLELHSSRGSLR